MNHLLKRFRRDITGLIWLSMGIFLSLALWSFNPQDPSFNTKGTGLVATNYCGYFGSFLSDILYQFMGLSAWILVLVSLGNAYVNFVSRPKEVSKLRFLWAGLLLATCASLCSLYFPKEKFFHNSVSVGGFLGAFLSSKLVTVFNFVGVAVILWTAVAVLLVFYSEKSLSELFYWPRKKMKKLYILLSDIFFLGKQFLVGRGGEVFLSGFRAMGFGLRFVFVGGGQKLFSWGREEDGLSRQSIDASGIIESSREGDKIANRFFKIDSMDSDKEVPDQQSRVARLFALSPERSSEEVPRGTIRDTLSEKRGIFQKAGSKEKTKDNNRESTKKRKIRLKRDVQRHIENWELPKLSLLEDPPASRYKVDDKEVREKAHLLVDKLEQFNVTGKVVSYSSGPAVTMFEFKPNAEVKISNITKLADDLSLALSSESLRIIAPIPGRDVVGIETSNSKRETVYLKEILAEEEFWEEDIKIPIALGQQADGKAKVVDMRKMPHLLVAGSTGSGKSVFTVSVITSLLFRHSPKSLRLILVDPKQVDLAAFEGLPHLLMPPIREAKKAVGALRWAIKEMEKRYRSMSRFGARGLEDFNEKVDELSADDVRAHEDYHENLEGAAKLDSYYFTPQPYIVIVVEEFADLMVVDKQNVENSVVRLAQMARACGIHLFLAMQSPRKDVVTGLIKTNIPGRVSFKVASRTDSRIILDDSGAERLLSRGDMLFLAPGVSKPARHHGPWVSDEDIAKVTEFWRNQGEPEYDPLALRAIEGSGGGFGFDLSGDEFGGDGDMGGEDGFDDRYDEILAFVSTQKTVSASYLQRRFRLGYPRAARLIEIMEEQGVIGAANGSKPRQVLVSELK